jgi:hypothetical protein
MLQVNPVNNRHNLRQFIRLPWSIYSDDPAWVPPLLLERKEHLSPHNPYFEHARYQSWIAHRDGIPMGRISAQIDQLHLERAQEKEGFFGMIEAEDNEIMVCVAFWGLTIYPLTRNRDCWLTALTRPRA